MATVKVIRPFWLNGEVMHRERELTMNDDDARSYAHSNMVEILEIGGETVQVAADNPLVPNPLRPAAQAAVDQVAQPAGDPPATLTERPSAAEIAEAGKPEAG